MESPEENSFQVLNNQEVLLHFCNKTLAKNNLEEAIVSLFPGCNLSVREVKAQNSEAEKWRDTPHWLGFKGFLCFLLPRAISLRWQIIMYKEIFSKNKLISQSHGNIPPVEILSSQVTLVGIKLAKSNPHM